MNNVEIVISVDEFEVRTALLENQELTELAIERSGSPPIAGNIYKGKVINLHKGMEAAFVDIGLEKNGFLYVSEVLSPREIYEEVTIDSDFIEEKGKKGYPYPDIEDVLKEGQEVLVQAVKEPIGGKGVRLSSYIALPGKFIVLMPKVNYIGVSRKITGAKERRRIKELLKEIKPQDMGIICRTVGEGKSREEFKREIQYLLREWRRIVKRASRAPAPQLIYQEKDLVYRTARDLVTEEVNRIVIDSRREYARLKRYLRTFLPHLVSRLELYTGKNSLFEAYELDKEIEKALQGKVWLKCGGYIHIEDTEALVSIDVNTGRYRGRGGLEETALKVNLEAAKEIARQLRLRDLGGIIAVDFIDMRHAKNREKLLATLSKFLEKDRSKTNILPLSELGLIEMTRKRIKENISNILCQSCPYCRGNGRVKSIVTLSINAQRKLKKICEENPNHLIRLKVHPLLAEQLKGVERNRISLLERKYRKKIDIGEDPDLHLQQMEVIPGKGVIEL